MPRTGETALVTGASGGIGLELARILAAAGLDLVLVARGAGKLEELGGDLAVRHGVRACALPADLADPAAPAALQAALQARGIEVSVLVNNAGFGVYGLFADTDPADELRMLQVNVVALTDLTKRLLPAMLVRRRGRILNVASTAAFQPGPLMAVYYASKAYVLSFSEALANELRGTGVTVTALCPGPTATGFQSAARMEGAWLLRRPLVMDAASVARAGYQGLVKGRSVVIPGLLNAALVQSIRLGPRRLVTDIVRRIQERAG